MPILNATTRAPYKNKAEVSCLQGTRRDKYKPAQAGREEEERMPPTSSHPCWAPPSLCLGAGAGQTLPDAWGPAVRPDGYCFCSFQPVGPDPQGSLNLRARICSGSDGGKGEALPPQPPQKNTPQGCQPRARQWPPLIPPPPP